VDVITTNVMSAPWAATWPSSSLASKGQTARVVAREAQATASICEPSRRRAPSAEHDWTCRAVRRTTLGTHTGALPALTQAHGQKARQTWPGRKELDSRVAVVAVFTVPSSLILIARREFQKITRSEFLILNRSTPPHLLLETSFSRLMPADKIPRTLNPGCVSDFPLCSALSLANDDGKSETWN
jgi:hypothetical protein